MRRASAIVTNALTSSGEHPLQNDLIVSTLIKYCSEDDLKAIRQVCQTWNRVCLERWRNTATVIVNQNESSHGGVAMQDLLDAYRGDEYHLMRRPFRKYKVQGQLTDLEELSFHQFLKNFTHYIRELELTSNLQINSLCLIKFLQGTGANLERLKLHADYEGFQLQKLTGVLKMTKLKTLVVTFNRFREFEWQEFFKNFPKLEDLTVAVLNNENLKMFCWDCDTPDNDPYFRLLLKDIQAIRDEDKTKLNLRRLDLIGYQCRSTISKMNMESIAAANMPLRELSLELSGWTNSAVIRDVLFAVSGTLKILTLSSHKEVPYKQFPFGAGITDLEELHLRGNVVSNFNLLYSFPNLRVLTILKNHNDWDMVTLKGGMIKERDCKVKELKYLHTLELDNYLDAPSWKSLARWLPNLKVLKAQLNNAAMKIIAEKWPDLEKVGIFFPKIPEANNSLSDKGITQLPRLKPKFRHFVMEPSNKPDMTLALTDICVQNGFLKMHALERLEIGINTQITKIAVAALEKKIGHLRVVVADINVTQ